MAEGIFYLLLALVLAVTSARGRCVQGENCKLPNCFCSNRMGIPDNRIPGGLNATDIPQLVMFAFDDAVNILNYDIYRTLFPRTKRNPNGCPIAMTLFVSHMWTNYDMVNDLYNRGMEIAVHSVTHRVPTDFWRTISEQDLRFEVQQQKENICNLGRVRERDIHGYRSPFLEPAGDLMFRILRESKLDYDSTYKGRLTSGRTPQQWPFTLDFGFNLACENRPCPRDRYPGFWEIPIIGLNDLDDRFICTYIDTCFRPPSTREETLELLWKNFEMNYNGARAPLYINMHSAWLSSFPFRMDAMEEFITRLNEMEEVYIVTYHQSLEWIRNPTRLRDITRFRPWRCNF